VRLLVPVTDDLVLDAGSAEQAGAELVIGPPKVTLFRQVIDYLRRKPDPPPGPPGPPTSLTYLGVLLTGVGRLG